MLYRSACIALTLLGSVQAAADQLRFQGVFDTVARCDARNPELCGENKPIDPFSFAFTVDVNRVDGTITTRSGTWVPYKLALPRLDAGVSVLTQGGFEALFNREYVTQHDLSAEREANSGSLSWLSIQSNRWRGNAEDDVNSAHHIFFERVSASLQGAAHLGDSGKPVTFAELSSLFDAYLESRRSVAVQAEYGRGFSFASGFSDGAWSRFSGDFGLTAICRAPSSLSRALASVASARSNLVASVRGQR